MTISTGVREAPIVAANLLLGSMNDLLRDPLGTYERACRDHGDVVRFRAGPPGLRADVYAVFSAEGAQQVLAGQAANFRKDNVFYEELRQTIGNGLLTSQDDVYLRQRRLVQPLFTRRRVDGYAGLVDAEGAALAAEWRGRGTVELVGEMHRFALRMVGRILFGTDMEKAFDVVERTLPPLQGYSLKRGLSPLKSPRAWPTPANRGAARLQGELFALCDEIIDSRRGGAGASDDLAGLLVHAGNAQDGRLDADELREQVLIFLVAGHETTATALAFTLHLLARHPEEQRRVQEEVDRCWAAPTGCRARRTWRRCPGSPGSSRRRCGCIPRRR